MKESPSLREDQLQKQMQKLLEKEGALLDEELKAVLNALEKGQDPDIKRLKQRLKEADQPFPPDPRTKV